MAIDKEKLRKDHKRLLRNKTYKISVNGTRGCIVNINQASGFNPGDRFYQLICENGIIELWPEKIFIEKYGVENE